jgi:4-hydroxybenzoate polyprenyltransferase
MIALIVATKQEASPFFGMLPLTEDRNAPYSIYRSPPDSDMPVVLLVCGFGKSAAAESTAYLLEHYPVMKVFNVGLCGALDDATHPGSLVRISGLCDGDQGTDAPSIECASGHFSGLQDLTLATVSRPVFDDERRSQLAQTAQVVDMEGFAIAECCARKEIECVFLKGVSDRADARGRHALRRNLSRVSRALANCVIDELKLPREKHGILSVLCEFVRIEHTLFSIPLILAGAWLGTGMRLPSLVDIVLIVMAGTGARTLGMAMNRILDRDLDALNERTLDRALPAGRIGLTWAYTVALGGMVLYLAACAALGRLCFFLSPFPVIALLTYSLFKRFTYLCHFGIGLCMAFGPAGAYVAVSGRLPLEPEVLLLTVFTFAWISGSDIIYALQDMDSDRAHGVYSLPARFGATSSQLIAAAVHLCSALALTALWHMLGMPLVSGLALLVALAALMTVHWQKLPLSFRFFPVSAIAGITGALVILLGGLP